MYYNIFHFEIYQNQIFLILKYNKVKKKEKMEKKKCKLIVFQSLADTESASSGSN